MPGLRRSCGFKKSYEGPWGGLVIIFGVMLPLLRRFWDSFWLSWGALGTHFGSLGAPWDAILPQVGPSWPNIAKKTVIFEFDARKLAQVGRPKSRKIDVKNDVFFECVFNIVFYGFLMDLGLRKLRFFGSIFELKAKTPIL